MRTNRIKSALIWGLLASTLTVLGGCWGAVAGAAAGGATGYYAGKEAGRHPD